MFVATLPVLFAFLCAIVDLGRVVFLGIALCDAAHEACRVASGLPVAAVSEEDLLDAAPPSLPGACGGGASAFSERVLRRCGGRLLRPPRLRRGVRDVSGAPCANPAAERVG